MKLKRISLFCIVLSFAALVLAGCTQTDNANSNTTATTNASPPVTASPSPQTLTVVGRPQKISDQMAARGEQDKAEPALSFVSPRNGETINSSTVEVKLNLGGGDLKGYKPMKDPATGMGNHIHIILDNQPYEAYYDLSQPFELRNVTEGKHTLRVFASRPWHESYKNAESFQMVIFTVKGGGADASKPTTTGSGQVMADNKNAANANASPTAPREGKDVAMSVAGDIDPAKPLLTYSRPKGEYKGADAEAIMIDFWLKNAKLQSEGGEYRVRYSVDGGEARYIDTWGPIWLKGWTAGKHMVKLELVDKAGNPIENGFNTTMREIIVTP